MTTLKIQDLIDIEQFQLLQDRLNEIYSFPAAIIDNDGKVLTATAWQDICTKFHRQNSECEKECIKSDQYIADHLHEANPAVSYRCPHGLVDNATPIIIDGVHYGNYFTGQFFLEPPDLNFFRAQANKYGFDEEAYTEAVKKVPIWTQEQLNSYLFFIKGLIEVIAGIGLKNLKAIEARQRMQEIEERHRSILQTAMDGFWMTDMQGRLLDVNEAYCRMSGYSAQELLGMRITDLEATETGDSTAARIQKIMVQGDDRFESRHRCKDGSIIDVEVSVQYRDTDGGQFVVFLRDITDRKQAEEKLVQERERLSAIIRGTNVGTWEWNVQTGETVFNDRWTEIIGYTLDELPPVSIETWMKFAHPDDLQQSGALLEQHFSGKLDYYEYESRMKHKNGDWIWVLDRGKVASWTADGKPLMMFGTHHDITERKRSEEDLKKNQHLLVISQRLAHMGSWETELSTGKLSWSDEMYHIMGFPDASPVYLDMALSVFPPDELIHFKEAIASAIRGDAPYNIDYTIKRHDGQVRTIHDEGEVVFDEHGTAVRMFGITQDITEHNHAEEEKAKLEAQLFQAQKMEAIGTLAGGVAHDFNNILAAIIGYTEMAMEESHNNIQSRYLQETLKGAERAKNLVKQILTFSRQGGHEKKPLDIKLLLKEAVKFLRASIPATIEIRQLLTDESCNILADPTQMHQIIMNLCTNADHAMKQTGGVLTMELSTIELSSGEISWYPDLRSGSYVKLTVSDTGHGIDSALQLRIFDPFFTTKSKDEGTGLGLSVVYGIVKSHDGIITVYSEPGKGASFNVYLPRIIHEEIINRSVSGAVTGGTERILFVDDEPALVDIGASMLSPLGYEVTGVTSSMEALDLFRSEPERFDLVITDMTLPKMTGINLSREIMQIRPDIPIILCSGIREAATEAQVKSLGIKAYCIKPLTRRDLSQVIRNTLGKQENLV